MYDAIVVGLGTWGSPSLYHLAKRGHSVLGIDRFAPPHTQGSSHGILRIMLAGLPLSGALRAQSGMAAATLPAWQAIERDAGEELLLQTGALFVGRPESTTVVDAIASCEGLKVPYELLSPDDIELRFPMVRARPHDIAVFERQTMLAFVDRAIQSMLTRSEALGATIHTKELATSWTVGSGGTVTLRTDRGLYTAHRLVLTPGAWIGDMVPGLGGFGAQRQVMTWFSIAKDHAAFAPTKLPVIMVHVDDERDSIYVTPTTDGVSVRAAFHFGGRQSHPDDLDREVRIDDTLPFSLLLEERFRGVNTVPIRAATCFYPMSPDGLFCLGHHPHYPQVILAGGGGGLGFRYGALTGALVAQLVEGRSPEFDLSAFDPARFLAGLRVSRKEQERGT